MTVMILIPGAMHGSWTWNRVEPMLTQAGHRVIAPDLPGMGAKPLVAAEHVTLDLWADFVADVIRNVGQPVILVGHSRGGLVIAEAAERIPDQVLGLIYVTALIVLPGQTALAAAQANTATAPMPMPKGKFLLGPAQAVRAFYNCCIPEDASWAAALLEPEPPAPIATKAGVTWNRWGRLPRAYVECTQDRVISIEHQRRMQAAAPCDPVIQIDTDHSPFLSTPRELAAAMNSIAQTWAI